MTFHANCLLTRKFALNGIASFLGKMRKKNYFKPGPAHDKTNKMACAPSEDSSALASPCQSLHCLHEESLDP